jgi:hypothetical protein
MIVARQKAAENARCTPLYAFDGGNLICRPITYRKAQSWRYPSCREHTLNLIVAPPGLCRMTEIVIDYAGSVACGRAVSIAV